MARNCRNKIYEERCHKYIYRLRNMKNNKSKCYWTFGVWNFHLVCAECQTADISIREKSLKIESRSRAHWLTERRSASDENNKKKAHKFVNEWMEVKIRGKNWAILKIERMWKCVCLYVWFCVVFCWFFYM